MRERAEEGKVLVKFEVPLYPNLVFVDMALDAVPNNGIVGLLCQQVFLGFVVELRCRGTRDKERNAEDNGKVFSSLYLNKKTSRRASTMGFVGKVGISLSSL
jgi:hypothetical protein